MDKQTAIDWIVAQMIATEMDTLTRKQRRLFLKLVNDKKHTEVFQEAFSKFEEIKKKINNDK